MGMFDIIMVPCPKCGIKTEFQSKSGDCTMNEFSFEETPDNVLVGIHGDYEYCVGCRTCFHVEVEGIPLLPRRTLKAKSVLGRP